MSNELLVFTHNDLDALGCMLNIEYKWPNVQKKYWHTNYANIDQIVAEILDYQQKNGNKHLLIPDVSFGDNKEALTKLYNAFEHITHIDHHLYADGFWDDYPNMKVVWDKTKSATKLCNEYLGNAGQNKGLDQLTYLIDVYDLWQTKEKAFKISQDLNEYFWRMGTTDLVKEFVQADYQLPPDYFNTVDQIHNEYNAAMESYEERKLIHRSNKITFAFIKDWFNQVLIKEMENGQNFVVGINPYGIVRVRVNQESGYTDKQLNALRLALTGTETTGHMHAFTYKISDPVNMDTIMQEAEKVNTAIQGV